MLGLRLDAKILKQNGLPPWQIRTGPGGPGCTSADDQRVFAEIVGAAAFPGFRCHGGHARSRVPRHADAWHLLRGLSLVGYPDPARHAKADVTIFQCLQTLAEFQAEAFDTWLCTQATRTKSLQRAHDSLCRPRMPVHFWQSSCSPCL